MDQPEQDDMDTAHIAPVDVTLDVKPDLNPDIKPSQPSLDHLFSPASPRSRPPTPPFPVSPRDKDGERGHGSSSSSRIVTPKNRSPPPPALIGDLPLAWDGPEGALATFEQLERCVYERKDIGLSREQDEMMVCDCVYDPDDDYTLPCGNDSNCINRAIFIECLASECKAGKHCRNQRFSRHQYAPVDVVLTERKGFGLRAKEDIPAGSLVYEYIGEVVVEKTMNKRMADYAAEGIKHFYFMMLQKEEYIDATKKGGIGRFANHSCNPNCEVQKWVVGRRMRMGIFTKRDVVKDEEITFNYNVDRYGHEAQICYCGEYNCVGTIGGKTQTDVGGIDDLFLDALGILDEVNANGMRGNKKKKARQLDEDYVPVLHPIQVHEVAKVAAAIRQAMELPRMLSRLLERVKMSDDPVVHRGLMRTHGFSLMSIILNDMAGDRDIVLMALQGMKQWQLTVRNKIDDSNIEEPVKALSRGDDKELAALANDLLNYWSTLELSYRIPRVNKSALDAEDDRTTFTIAEADSMPRRHMHYDELANNQSIRLELAPVREYVPPPIRHRPPPPPPPSRTPSHPATAGRSHLDAIIAMAAQAAAVPPSPLPGNTTPQATERDPRKRLKLMHAEEEERKEKRLTKLVGEVVVKSMSKYKSQMEHDTFKRYAKQCTATLVEKEKRGKSYAENRHPTLDEEKKAKMKLFTKEYTHKLLRNLKQKGKLRHVPRPDKLISPSTPAATPGGSSAKLSPSATPGRSTHSHSETPNGSALLDEMFGADDEMDVDSPSLATETDAAPSSAAGPATPQACTPHSPQKAIVVEHSGPIFAKTSKPILVDRFEGSK